MAVYGVKRIVLESAPVITACVLVEMVTGSSLVSIGRLLVAVPAFLMLMPALNDMAGDFGQIMGARISTALHMGLVEPKVRGNSAVKENLLVLLITGVISSIYLSVLVQVFCSALGLEPITFVRSLAVTLLAGFSVTLTTALLSTLVSFFSYLRGLDPDNTTVPIVTSVADLLGVLCLLFALQVVGLI